MIVLIRPSFVTVILFLTVTAAPPQVPADATQEFQSGIQHYLTIHKQASETIQPLPAVADPAAIVQHEQELNRAIRALRSNAQRGDIFTTKVRTYIANAINMKVDTNARMAILGEGNPRAEASLATISIAVNATYPASAPLSTMPPALLMALPSLPPELEFRFVGHALILRDRKANMIVEIMTDAI